MSRATVRQAVTDYLNSANIPGIAKIYKAPAWWVDGQKFATWENDGWGSVVMVNLDQQSETRNTLSAPSISHGSLIPPVGDKQVSYKVGLLVIFQWLIPPLMRANPLEDADAWTEPLDQVLQSIIDLIRADPNLGAPDVIFQAGQDQDDIRLSTDIPKLDADGGIIHIWSVIQFNASEIISA